MRKLLLLVWFLIPVGAWAYHMGPGQDALRVDSAAERIAAAEQSVARAALAAIAKGEAAARNEWKLAAEAWAAALDELPAEAVDVRRRVRLEQAKAQMFIGELPQANGRLTALVDELRADESAAPELRQSAERALASSEYYLTWLMRLEGAPRAEWEPRIETARQTYKALLVSAEQEGAADETLDAHRKDLESAIRLARMDLTELQGLPLPSQ